MTTLWRWILSWFHRKPRPMGDFTNVPPDLLTKSYASREEMVKEFRKYQE